MAEQTLDDVFIAAIEIASPQERAAFIAEACGEDVDLRRRVEQLAAAHFRAGSFLESPAAVGTADEPSPEELGTVIGPFKLLQELGEGGMGTVYLAEQTQPVQRKVALKLIKPGMDSKAVLARFEAERQALALMDHPNISKVLDAGATAAGRPYFVMELVKGLPITRYCDQQHLSPRERLELFVPVCHAVQHAHQKGVIHRDLKPSNVLIGLYDGRPVPKVIDFGVAKATEQKLTERTLFTEVGQIVGTLEYMAPEQAELNNLDIDTRADVYSLGVLLYELLTGSPPFTARQLRGEAFMEMLRIIREVEPPKPSTRLSTSEELPAIAANRKLEPKKLTRLVHGELDWIVMRCLEKERGRRYETANGLAMEIQRYLADEPVLAGPPGVRYRLRKFLHRRKVPVLVGSLVVLLLVGGVVGSSLGLVRALNAEEQTRGALTQVTEERDRVETARIQEVKARDDARKAAAKFEAVNKYLVRGMLAAADPAKAQGRKITVEEVLDSAAATIGTAFPDDPEVEGEVRDTIAYVNWYLGRYAAAEEQWAAALTIARRAFGEEHPHALSAMSNLAMVLKRRGRLAEAEALRVTTLDVQRRVLGPDHPDTLTSSHNLVMLLIDQGKWAEAEPVARQLVDTLRRVMGEDHAETLQSTAVLAGLLRNRGKLAEAEPLSRTVLDLHRRRRGEKDPETLRAMNNLGLVLAVQNKLDEAEGLLRKALEHQRSVLGDEHDDTLSTLLNLAYVWRGQGKLAEGEASSRQTLEVFRRKFGEDHRKTMLARNNLVKFLTDQEKLAEAEPLCRENLDRQRRVLGVVHPDTLLSSNNLAQILRRQGKLAEAEVLSREALEAHRQKVGEDHPMTLTIGSNLATLLRDQGKPAEAEPLARQVFDTRRRVAGTEDPETLQAMSSLAELLADLNRLPEARRLYGELLELRRKTKPDGPGEIAVALAGLGSVLTQSEPSEGERLVREAQGLLRQVPPRGDGDWVTAHFQGLLGASLAAQGRHKEAEPELLQSYDALQGNPAAAPLRKQQAVRRLIQLYQDWGKPDKATEWRAKLPPSPGPKSPPPAKK